MIRLPHRQSHKDDYHCDILSSGEIALSNTTGFYWPLTAEMEVLAGNVQHPWTLETTSNTNISTVVPC
ncbi:Uncharacterized protein HZ326_4494 [Fusarium oxysporum f. sp. albedinis]|nr:Uncharacterized protein HZ326_4494 [Fusarium oxysporum f. sp. albedinis]